MVAVQLLAVVGAAVLLKALYSLASFLTLYLQAPAYRRYLHNSSGSTYALITGASDGIGKAVAKELYSKGFNVIIHGRHEKKLRKVQEELKRNGSGDVKMWIADADTPNIDFEAAMAQWEGLQISLVINNVGGSAMRPVPMDRTPEDELMEVVCRNALFPFRLTRALLPSLRKVPGPAQVIFVGSASGDLPLPTLVPYTATKAFIKQLSICANQDERFRTQSNVSVMYVNVGSVASGSHRVTESLGTPSAEKFAQCIVARIGCGRTVISPYMIHGIQAWLTSVLPSSALENLLLKRMEEELKWAEASKATEKD